MKMKKERVRFVIEAELEYEDAPGGRNIAIDALREANFMNSAIGGGGGRTYPRYRAELVRGTMRILDLVELRKYIMHNVDGGWGCRVRDNIETFFKNMKRRKR